MKTTEFKLGVKTLHLFFNGEAMFQADALDQNLPADSPGWFPRMLEQTAEGKRLLCKVAHILATQGELCRRYLQYPHERIPTEEEINLLLTPMAWVSLRSAVAKAVDDGYGAPTQGSENDDIDLGLMELEKKNESFTVAAYLNLAAICNIPPRDALLLLQPGQMFDLFNLWCERHGIRKEE